MASPLAPSTVGDLTTLGLSAASNARVLVVGDGNFSYARAFVRHNRAAVDSKRIAVVATSLDTRDELLGMYPNAHSILDELHGAGVRVLHGVNATSLPSDDRFSAESFDRIVFNFPHFAEGGNRRNKIHRHRQLLKAFFASAVEVLDPLGQIWVALCAGQGGTTVDTTVRSWGDTWQIVSNAAAAGLLLESVHACPVDALAALGYSSVGYQLRERAFWTTDSLSHVFCRADAGREAQLPIEWSRDLSFWTLDGFSDAKVVDILRQHFPEETMDVAIERLDSYHCPATGRDAATYKICVRTTRVALTHDDANARATAALLAIEASDFAASRDT